MTVGSSIGMKGGLCFGVEEESLVLDNVGVDVGVIFL